MTVYDEECCVQQTRRKKSNTFRKFCDLGRRRTHVQETPSSRKKGVQQKRLSPWHASAINILVLHVWLLHYKMAVVKSFPYFLPSTFCILALQSAFIPMQFAACGNVKNAWQHTISMVMWAWAHWGCDKEQLMVVFCAIDVFILWNWQYHWNSKYGYVLPNF